MTGRRWRDFTAKRTVDTTLIGHSRTAHQNLDLNELARWSMNEIVTTRLWFQTHSQGTQTATPIV